jgi:hypothetical protein
MAPELHEVLERLESVEKQNRRLKWAGSLLLIAIALAGLAIVAVGRRTGPPEVIQARKFVLLDDKGRVRADLSMGRSGAEPELALYDEEGRVRAVLDADVTGPYLGFYDRNGLRQVVLGADQIGGSSLALYVGGGLYPVLKAEAGQFGASLSFFDPEDTHKLRRGGIDARATLEYEIVSESSSLSFSDKAGKVVWSTPLH